MVEQRPNMNGRQKENNHTDNHNKYTSLMNHYVTINGNGPDSNQGVLLGVGNEHLALLTDNGIVYYQLKHIKGVSKQQNNSNNMNDYDLNFEVEKVTGFNDVLKAFRHKWVYLNGSKKDSIEGFLSEVHDDRVIIINNGEVFYVFIYHIKSIGEAVKNNNKNDKENKNEQKDEGHKNNHKSEGNRSQHQGKESKNKDDRKSEQHRSRKAHILINNGEIFSNHKN